MNQRKRVFAGVVRVVALIVTPSIFMAQPAMGLNLGDAIVQSTATQPLDIMVELADIDDINPALVQFRQATVEEYEQFHLTPELTRYQLKPFSVMGRNGKSYVRLTTENGINKRDLTLLLVAEWPGGKRFKAYSFVLSEAVVLESVEANTRLAQRQGAAGNSSSKHRLVQPNAPKVRTGEKSGVVIGEQGQRDNGARTGSATSANTSGGAVIGHVDGDRLEVQNGTTLWRIGGDLSGPGTRYQKMLALYQANPSAFIDGNINLIKSGAKLVIPSGGQIAQLSPKLAASEFRDLMQRYSTAPLASAVTRTDNSGNDTTATRASVQEQNASQPNVTNDKVLTITNPDFSLNEGDRTQDGLASASDETEASAFERLQDRISRTEESLAAADQSNKKLQQTAESLDNTLSERERLINLTNGIGSQRDLSADDAEPRSSVFVDNDAQSSDLSITNNGEDRIAIRDSLDQEFDNEDLSAVFDSEDRSLANSANPDDEATNNQSNVDSIVGTGGQATDSEALERPEEVSKSGIAGLLALGTLLIGVIWWLLRRRKFQDVDNSAKSFDFKPVLKSNLNSQESEALIAKANRALDGSWTQQAGDMAEELIDRKTPHIMATIQLVGRLADAGSFRRSRLLVNKLNDFELTTKEEGALEELQDSLSAIAESDLSGLEDLQRGEDRNSAQEDRKNQKDAVEQTAETTVQENRRVSSDTHDDTRVEVSNLVDEEEAHLFDRGTAKDIAAKVVAATTGAITGGAALAGMRASDTADTVQDSTNEAGDNGVTEVRAQVDPVEDTAETPTENLAESIDEKDDAAIAVEVNELSNDPQSATDYTESIVDKTESITAEEVTEPVAQGTYGNGELVENVDEDVVVSTDEYNQDNNNVPEGMSGEVDVYSSRLDLAKAYLEMGDGDTANALLKPVLTEGTREQVRDAQQLLERYSGSYPSKG